MQLSHHESFPEPLYVGRPNVGDRADFLRRVNEILDRNWLTNDGPVVREFEDRLASFLGVEHLIAVCNGTIGLEIAIRAAGLAGEVITPSYTFVATAHALSWQGIKPVFADIDARTHQIDCTSVLNAITPRTTGILAVHLWGRPAPVSQLQEIATSNNLSLIYDAAHAFAGSIGPAMIGTFGQAEVFSFHATKFFNTLEGGAIATNDAELARKARLMRNFGFVGEDSVTHLGTNGKMPEISAAMGLTNLATIDTLVAANEENFKVYRARAEAMPDLRILEQNSTGTSNFQYVVVEIVSGGARRRDRVVDALRDKNVWARRYFWPGIHRMGPYRNSPDGQGVPLPITEAVADRVIVLPTGVSVTPADVERIMDILRDALLESGCAEGKER